MKYYQIIDEIIDLSLEDKEALLDTVQDMVDREYEDMPHQPDHHDEHRRIEIRSLRGINW